jgi:hypothetical protein
MGWDGMGFHVLHAQNLNKRLHNLYVKSQLQGRLVSNLSLDGHRALGVISESEEPAEGTPPLRNIARRHELDLSAVQG